MRQRNIPRRRGMNCLQENRDRSTLRPRFFAFIFPIQKGGHAQMERYEYPFSALVGQEKLKTALLLNLVEPRLGGVLIQGEKGTAKSTAVRGLAELMDEVEVAEGCPFHCRMDGEALCDECRSSPARRAVPYRRRVVELPVSATEDRVVGTLDLERALKEGVRAFEPGLLAQANGNILYVDEINLLEDRSDEEIVQNILGSLDTSGRKYWTLTKDQALLFVKDITETNRYKGLTTETFFTSDSAAHFLKKLAVNRVVHQMITLDGDRYVASGVIFEYNGAQYKICLLTNDTVILDNNVFLSSKIGLYVFGAILLGMLLLVAMIFANVVDLRDRRIRKLEKHITSLNKVLEEQTETIREMDSYHTRWSIFRLPMLEMFVDKLAERKTAPLTFVELEFASKEERKHFLNQAQILLDEKVIRFENSSDQEIVLLFLQYEECEAIKGIEAVSAQAGECKVLQSETYTGEGEALITVYERFTKKLAERMEQDDDEHNISGIQI